MWNQTMTYGRLGAKVTAQSWTGHSHNGYLVFDYVDSGNYKYAGMAAGSNKWQIKEAIDGTHYLRAEFTETITVGQSYNVLIEVSGNTATLKVGGVTKTSHTFASGIHGGKVGLYVYNAHAHFKEVVIKVPVNVTKYYAFGGQRVAMRQDNVAYFLLGDHLGTTSVVLDSSGNVVAESRHYPYGEVRWTWPEDESTFPTDYRFTGQRDVGLGLTHMGARFLDTVLGRWTSADTIVPEPGNPQSLNRYSYTQNNPVKYRDPSGHMEIYGGSLEPYADFWYTYVNPDAPGCRASQEHIAAATALSVDVTPAIGDLEGLIEVGTGRDLITGEDLGNWRWAGLFGLVGLAEIRLLRHADEGADVLRLIFKVEDTIGATGQWQHVLPNKVMRVLDRHNTLSGVFERNTFLVRAFDEAGHKGYQTWHRAYDAELVRWLQTNPNATERQFLEYLLEIYSRPEMLEKLPGGEELLKQALEVSSQ